MALTKELDYEAFLTGFFLPQAVRHPFFAIRAFNCEVGTIKDAARGNSTTGRMRMMWWRETLDGVYGGAPQKHPVAAALQEAIAESPGLSRRWFDRIIDAREGDLTPEKIGAIVDVVRDEISDDAMLVLGSYPDVEG